MQNTPCLPHHRLHAFGVARELLVAVRDARIRSCSLRDQALRAATSVCLNCAEGAGRVTRADKARAFTIARGEAVEAAAAVESRAGQAPSGDIPDPSRMSASSVLGCQAALYSGHSPGTPLSLWVPRCSNSMPERAVRSLTDCCSRSQSA